MNVKFSKDHQIKILNSDDMYGIMQRILLRENKIDRNREHFWTVSLDNANKLLNIELVSMGTVNKTLIEPMEVFSVPLQKRAVKIILVHNHPSGEIKPGESDKDQTDRLIQVGKIMNVPVIDHLIITEKTYYSFIDSGLLQELEQSTKYVPDYKLKEIIRKKIEEEIVKRTEENKTKEIARQMKIKGYTAEQIAELTGLSLQQIKKLKPLPS